MHDPAEVDAVYSGRHTGYVYARDGHPNAALLARKMAELEGAESGWVCASGMSAIAASVLALLENGSEVALADGMYGKTLTLLRHELNRFGVIVQLFDASNANSLEHALSPRTRLILVETLTNPLVRVADLHALGRTAQRLGIPLLVDHTFAPLLCKPIELGADLVVHSATKLIGGHSDLTLGLVLGKRELISRIAAVASTFGMTGNPFESWLTLRGLATLPLRSHRACTTALALAERLHRHPRVRQVHYPGLASHPDHARARQLLRSGFGTIVTIDLGSGPSAGAFLKGLSQIPFAPSLGDVSTTTSHPASTSHRNQPPELLAHLGITPGLVRLSIGLENPEDLWWEIAQVLDGLPAVL
jgi:cystathionine beta-lyase/cystathionine gamma-synthase